MRIPRYAVIPSNGRECLFQCLEAIRPQVNMVFVVFTGKFITEAERDRILRYGYILYEGPQDPNISRWWNQGLEAAADCVIEQLPGPTKWDVAVLNDDAIVP